MAPFSLGAPMEEQMNAEVMYKLGAIETMLKAINEKLDKHVQDATENHKDHEARISKLERAGIKQHGIVIGVGGLGAGLFELLKFITGN